MKTYQKVILIVGIVLSALVTLAILGTILFVWLTGNAIKDTVEDARAEAELVDSTYESIPPALMAQSLFPRELKQVGSARETGGLFPDDSHRYYFYIAPDQYEQYQHYWLEGVDEADYCDEYNKDLWQTGDYVFGAIEINDCCYAVDTQRGNLLLKADTTYYHVTVHNNAIYYEYLTAYRQSDGTQKYDSDCSFRFKEDSVTAQYMLHRESGEWVIEEIS